MITPKQMMRRCILFLVLILWLVAAACSSKGETQLSKALSVAVREKKITQKKLESILVEYNKIRSDDKKKAHEYVTQVLNAIEMGGDSSHIDAARRQILNSKADKVKV